ncbi:MAG: recombinase family protein [Pseudomonadota bacterium]
MNVVIDDSVLPRTRGKQQAQRLRCAIYTRKSTEKGLDQDFNSLDAQRDACAAYISSQASQGWKLSSSHYGDGGMSGGTMDRPALKQLLSDIKHGMIDIVVVYKIDRLTRSLMDFAKMVDVFDDKGISFVSVTQQFNTTTSMGRLTLNVLLSFAQFEREVTAERIKDKIAASKKKGMWMGGTVPLGYKSEDKKLVIDKTEAKTVRWLFEKYLELGSAGKLSKEANRVGLTTRNYTPKNGAERKTAPFGRGNLYHLLSNPIYIGKIRHQEKVHDGQHEAIVDEELWASVQNKMEANTNRRQSKTNSSSAHLLTGLIFDEHGRRLSTTHTIKNGRRYYYYISQNQGTKGEHNQQKSWRIRAKELERPVLNIVNDHLTDPNAQIDSLNLHKAQINLTKSIVQKNAKLAKTLKTSSTSKQKTLLSMLLKSVVLSPEKLIVELDFSAMMSRLKCIDDRNLENQTHTFKLEVSHQIRRRGIEAKLVLTDQITNAPRPDQTLIKLIANAHLWLTKLTDGSACSIFELAEQQQIDATEISRFLPLAFLAPDIIESILAGSQPVDLTTDKLRRMNTLPISWNEQREVLGFAA